MTCFCSTKQTLIEKYLYMLELRKYSGGKYSVISINEILFKSRVGELTTPSNLHTSINKSTWSFIKKTVRAVFSSIKKGTFLNRINIKSLKLTYEDSLLFYLPSINNQRALQGVYDIISKQKPDVKWITKTISDETVPTILVYIISLLYLPLTYIKLKKLSPKEQRIASYYFKNFAFTPGVVYAYFKILSKYRPECIILSNDHYYFMKIIGLVAEDLGIPTLYVQHASVSNAFPELHFKYSFLDGKDTLDKYTYNGKKAFGNIFLLGAVRYDSLSATARKKTGCFVHNCIGIGINLIDDESITRTFCENLLKEFPFLKIKIRSHPALKNNPFNLGDSNRIVYTCATDESIQEFFNDIDLLISNDSGIHFDATIAGIKTYQYNFSTAKDLDNYNYVKNGLVRKVDSWEEMKDIITHFENEKLPNDEIVRFYDESYNKGYQGKCHEIIADFILHGYSLDYIKDTYHLQEEMIDNTNVFKIMD